MKKRRLILAALLAAALSLSVFAPAAYAAEEGQGEAPVIFKVTDAVSPGEQFSINGEFFTPASEVYARPAGGGQEVQLSVTQYDAADEQYLVCRFPGSLHGAYALRVENEYGTSGEYTLNGPRALYISEDEVWAGQTVHVSGRNFDPDGFGGGDVVPSVSLVDAQTGTSYAAPIAEEDGLPDYNNFRIAFTVPNVPAGSYEVHVSTFDGTDTAPSSGQTLTVTEAGSDPLGLGAAWADAIDWSAQFSVTQYGAVAGDGQDDTAAIQSAVNAAYEAGGGQVTFPAGEFELTYLELPDYVALVGAGMDKTVLLYAATDDANTFIVPAYNKNRVGYTGIADLTIRNPYTSESEAPAHSPDVYVQLGESDRGQDHDKYTNEGLFVKNVTIDYPMAKPQKAVLTGGKNRGLGLMISGSHVVVDNVHVKGFGGALGISNHSYARVENSSFEYSITQFNVLNGYSFVLGNTVRGRREFITAQDGVSMHGMMCRNDIHFEGNDIRGVGTGKNDGEVICVEVPGGNFGYGRVESYDAEQNRITLAEGSGIVTSGITTYGRFKVAIVDGRGKGQSVTAERRDYFAQGIVQLNERFAVEPDETSVVSFMSANENVTVYDNYGEDCCKSILMYGNVIDAAVDSNTVVDTDGIMVWGSNSGNAYNDGQGLPADMYISIRGNHVSGASPLTHNTSIDVTSGRFIGGMFGQAGSYSCTMVYAVDIRGNTVEGDPSITQDMVVPNETEAAPWQGIVLNSCVYSTHRPIGTRIGDLTNILVLGNTLDNTRKGIVYTHTIEGIVIEGNVFGTITEGNAYRIHNQSAGSATPSVAVDILQNAAEDPDPDPDPEPVDPEPVDPDPGHVEPGPDPVGPAPSELDGPAPEEPAEGGGCGSSAVGVSVLGAAAALSAAALAARKRRQ